MSEDSFDISRGLKERNPETGRHLFLNAQERFNNLARGFNEEVTPLSLESYNDKASEYRNNLLEETEGVEYSEGEKPIYLCVDSEKLGEDDFDELSQRVAKVVDTLKGVDSRSFSSNFDMLGCISASFYPKDSQIGIDQRKIWTGLSVSDGNYRVGLISDAYSDFLKSEQGPDDLEFLFIQILGEEEIVKKEHKQFFDGIQEKISSINTALHELHPESFHPVGMDSTLIVGNGSDIRKYNLEGNLDFPIHDYGKGASANGIVSDFGHVIEDGPYIVIKEPYIYKGMKPEDLEKSAMRTLAVITHESIHGGKQLGDEFRFGTPDEIALELITDYSTFVAFNKAGIGKREEDGSFDDWRDKTAYLPFIKLAIVLKNEAIFGEIAIEDDQILKFGVDQDWKGFVAEVDTMFDSLSAENRQAFIDEIDRRLLIGPDEYQSLMNSQKLTFMDVGNAMLSFQQKIGTMPYFTIGMLIDNMQSYAPDIKDMPLVEAGKYFMGTKEEPTITKERRQEKHEILKQLINA